MAFDVPPAFRFGPATDWSPLASSIDGYGQGVEQAYKGETNRLAGALYAQGKNKEAASLAAGRGDLPTALAFQKADREQRIFDEDTQKRMVERFGGIASRNAEILAKDPTNAQALNDWRTLYTHPLYGEAFRKSPAGYKADDAANGWQLMSREYKDWTESQLKALQLKEAQTQDRIRNQLREEEGMGPPNVERMPRTSATPAAPQWGQTTVRQGSGMEVPVSAPQPQAAQPRQGAITVPNVGTFNPDEPLFNIASEYSRATRLTASGLKEYAPVAEQKLKLLTTMMDKNIMPTRGGGVTAIPGAAESTARTAGMTKVAEKEQENFQKANTSYMDASTLESTARDLKSLAGNAILGSGADYELAARKMAARLGYSDPRISATELLKSGLTKFISAEAQKLKPVSASDIAFIERSVGGLSSDPSSLPHILAAWERAAQKAKLFHEIEAQAYRMDLPGVNSTRGFPNYAAIKQYVDSKMPSYVDEMMAGGQKGVTTSPATGASVEKPVQERLPQNGAAPQVVTRQDIANQPDGPITMPDGTRMIKRGTKFTPVSGELGSRTNPIGYAPDATTGKYFYQDGKLHKRTGWFQSELVGDE